MKHLSTVRAWTRKHPKVALAVVALGLAAVAEFAPGVPLAPLTALAHAFIGV